MRAHRWIVSALVVVCGMWWWALGDVVEVVDQVGETVRVESPVERVASVYGISTYYLYALGVGNRLVAGWYVGLRSLSQASETMLRFEPELEELMNYGDPNVEEILALDVDLVLADGSQHAAFAEQMSDLGVPTIQCLVESFDAMREALRLTGEAFGDDANERAEALTADLDRVLAQIGDDLADLPEADRARVLFVGTSSLQIASGDMYQTELIDLAGGQSVAGDLVGSWNEVNLEQVLLWNPDVIVIAPYGPVQPSDLLHNPDWAAVAAVRDGRVVRMPRLIAPMDTPVPESLLGVLWLADALYPLLVSLDLREEAARFYADYYGLDLTDAELDLLTGE